MKAVGYIRVSSTGQVDGYSLDAQRHHIEEYCLKNGLELIETYCDAGKSAHVDSIEARPGFRRLLDHAPLRRFEVVVIHTLDRWARNLDVMLQAFKILDRASVEFKVTTETIDTRSPEGILSTQVRGAVHQFSSSNLSTHVKKGLEERANQGRRCGGIPYGYLSCWVEGKGEKMRRCDPEHPGGVHVVPQEVEAIKECFRRYASGTTTLSQLATWLNDQGLRTRNTHKLPGPDGTITGGPRLFTTDSLKVILHNPFYTGNFRHSGKLHRGTHEAIVGQELFDLVQDTLKRNSGRSMTLTARPQREYLLKGIIRCAYCKMPMWAQTYKHGTRVYREHRTSRGHAVCPSHGGSISCATADEQIGKLIEAIELRGDWLEGALARISIQDEVKRVKAQRHAALDKLRRLGRAFCDALVLDEEYVRRKRHLEQDLESLIVPEANAAVEAGKLLKDLPRLWRAATMEERRRLILTMLDGVYFDAKVSKAIVAIKPKSAFRPVFQVATTRENSGIQLINEGAPGEFRKAPVFVVETGEPRTPSGTPPNDISGRENDRDVFVVEMGRSCSLPRTRVLVAA